MTMSELLEQYDRDRKEAAKERALSLFARARAPQRSGAPAEAVRVIDGAGTEVFRWSRFDEPA